MAAHTPNTPGGTPAVNATARPKRARSRRDDRQIDAADVEIIPPFPEEPPQTPEERAAQLERIRIMQGLIAELRQRNLQNAVLLAQQAAAGNGPLVDHFAELGRPFAHELRSAPSSGRLQLVDGGAA